MHTFHFPIQFLSESNNSCILCLLFRYLQFNNMVDSIKNGKVLNKKNPCFNGKKRKGFE